MDDHDFIRVDIEHTPETCPACRLKTLRVAIREIQRLNADHDPSIPEMRAKISMICRALIPEGEK